MIPRILHQGEEESRNGSSEVVSSLLHSSLPLQREHWSIAPDEMMMITMTMMMMMMMTIMTCPGFFI